MGCTTSTDAVESPKLEKGQSSDIEMRLPPNAAMLNAKTALQLVLNTPVAREKFRAYLRETYADETLLFYIEVEELKSTSEDELQAKALSIWERFAKPGARLAVNISDNQKGALREELQKLVQLDSLSLRSKPVEEQVKGIAPAQEAVLDLMSMSCFPGFLESKWGKTMITEFSKKEDEKLKEIARKSAKVKKSKDDKDIHWLENFIRAAEKLPVCICLTDMEGKDQPVVYINREFSIVTGYSKDETIGRNCRFLQGKETTKESVDQIRTGLHAAQNVDVCVTNYRKNGEMFTNFLSMKPIFNSKLKLKYFVGIQFDVTEAAKEGRIGIDMVFVEGILRLLPTRCD